MIQYTAPWKIHIVLKCIKTFEGFWQDHEKMQEQTKFAILSMNVSVYDCAPCPETIYVAATIKMRIFNCCIQLHVIMYAVYVVL